MIFPAVTNYLQTSSGSCSYFFSYRQGEANTHIKSLLTSVFLPKAHFVKFTPHSSPLFHQENAAENISAVISVVVITYIYVLRCSSLVLAGLQDAVWCDKQKTCASTQPYIAFATFEFTYFLYSFLLVIPRCLNSMCRRFRTLCHFHFHR